MIWTINRQTINNIEKSNNTQGMRANLINMHVKYELLINFTYKRLTLMNLFM